jgi:VanZ family protein
MLRFLLPLAWAAVILWLSSGPQFGIPPRGIFQPDKIGHFGVYAILSAFTCWAFHKKELRPFLLGILLCTGYGVLMEFMQQAYFYGRQLDVFDMLANFLGCLAGAWVVWRWAGSIGVD